MDNKKKLIILIVSIIALILLIIGGTYAYWSWSSNENQATNVVFTVTPDFSCSADAGGHITSNGKMLAPTDCMDPEYAIQRTITTSSTTTGDKVISMDLWLNVNNISTNLLNSPNFKYAITKNINSCTSGVINSGVIGTDITNNKIDLLEGVEYSTLGDTYYLYIWLDEAENSSNTMNQSFDFSIDGECNDSGLEKALLKDLNTTDYFREQAYITKITDIEFIYESELPNGLTPVKTYDLGADANKPIMGYLVNGDTSGTYKLYVSSEYKIYAQGLENAFRGMTALKNISFDNFDTSGTTTMKGMFYGDTSLTTLDLSLFNTSNVHDMSTMFSLCTGLISLNIEKFNTSNVTDMGGMFQICTGLTTLDVSSFDTSNVGSMQGMFMGHSTYGGMQLHEIIGIGSFNLSSVTTIQGMFQFCSNLTTLDLSNWNTSGISNMQGVFYEASSLISIDLSGWSTASVTNTKLMFRECTSLENIYVSSLWNLSGVSSTNSASMFQGDTKLPNFNSSVIDKTNAHYGSGGYLTYKAHN